MDEEVLREAREWRDRVIAVLREPWYSECAPTHDGQRHTYNEGFESDPADCPQCRVRQLAEDGKRI